MAVTVQPGAGESHLAHRRLVHETRLCLGQVLRPHLVDATQQLARVAHVLLHDRRLGREGVGLTLTKRIDRVYELVLAAVDSYRNAPECLLRPA